jgi:hypothetical protein
VEDAIRNTPLLAARHSLLLARSLVVEQRYSEAIPPLLTTAEALAFFEGQEIGRYEGHAGVAGDVRQEILNYANDIETDHDDALSNIEAWLDQIREWSSQRASGK